MHSWLRSGLRICRHHRPKTSRSKFFLLFIQWRCTIPQIKLRKSQRTDIPMTKKSMHATSKEINKSARITYAWCSCESSSCMMLSLTLIEAESHLPRDSKWKHKNLKKHMFRTVPPANLSWAQKESAYAWDKDCACTNFLSTHTKNLKRKANAQRALEKEANLQIEAGEKWVTLNSVDAMFRAPESFCGIFLQQVLQEVHNRRRKTLGVSKWHWK